ncbi:hypothetical protein HMPREF1548_06876 [Clostridium sp. KLE 1755]|nr:hypothetical protein HMPREF1548_06876 [Clostridium sp. KLE 1755]
MHGYLATAARVKYPAALQRCKFDTPLLAAGSLISAGNGPGIACMDIWRLPRRYLMDESIRFHPCKTSEK